MDIWFTLFVAIVALAAAVGASLILVGYINALPACFAGSRKWGMGVLIIPVGMVAIPAALAFMAAPFVEVMPVATLARWLAIPAGAVHLVALAGFFKCHWQDNAKTGKQLLGGLGLLLLAVALLYGIGPMFAERIVAGAK